MSISEVGVLPNGSADTARAVILHRRARESVSDTNEQTSPAAHASPRMKRSSRRKEGEDNSNADDDNVTVTNAHHGAGGNSSRPSQAHQQHVPQPSGRGEVGGSTLPAEGGADAAPVTSCIDASVVAVAPAPAASQLASVHMVQAEPGSESNQQAEQGEEEQEVAKRGRGRPKGGRKQPRLEGSVSVVSPSDADNDAGLLMSGTDSVKRGRGRPKGSRNKSRASPAAAAAAAAGEGKGEDEDENEPSSPLSEDDDPTPAASTDDANRTRRGTRSRATANKPSSTSKAPAEGGAEGGGANEEANEFPEPPRKRARGRPPKGKADSADDAADAQVPEGSTVDAHAGGCLAEGPRPTASVAQASGGGTKEGTGAGGSDAAGEAAGEQRGGAGPTANERAATSEIRSEC